MGHTTDLHIRLDINDKEILKEKTQKQNTTLSTLCRQLFVFLIDMPEGEFKPFLKALENNYEKVKSNKKTTKSIRLQG